MSQEAPIPGRTKDSKYIYWKGDPRDTQIDSRKVCTWLGTLSDQINHALKDLDKITESVAREIVVDTIKLFDIEDVRNHLSITPERINCDSNPFLISLKKLCNYVVLKEFESGTKERAKLLLDKMR